MLPREEDDMNTNITLNGKEAKTLLGLKELLQQEVLNVVRNEVEAVSESDVEEMITSQLDSELDQYIENWCDNHLEERIQNVFRDKLTLSVDLV